MFNKKFFCNGRFHWVVIAIAITAACASGSHEAKAANIHQGSHYEYHN
ncbi:MAG TPA: hypothetical protein VL995_00790 [Cellvibrio sp.]|nr:hypothetical protein [Cellvibrio sp.]